MPTDDACDREAAWLAASGDGLPALLTSAGGPFGVVQAYWPGNRLATQKPGLYVTRRVISDEHPMAQRYRPHYEFAVKIKWPLRATAPLLAETEQRRLDAAVELFLARVRGPVGDKTHGNRFLSAGEAPEFPAPSVAFDDPEVTIPAAKELRAVAVYYADDIEFTG